MGIALRGHIGARFGPEHPPAEAGHQASKDEDGDAPGREPPDPMPPHLARPFRLSRLSRGLSALAPVHRGG
jgi:hypothetical protein